MIVSTKDDMVRLSGALAKNQWLTIKAAANLLLQAHPEGILIDCSELDHVTEDGAKTFLEAMRDIQAAGARILVVGLPDNVLEVIRSVPGVRSQLPIAASIEEARASLRLSSSRSSADAERQETQNGVLVPLMEGGDVEFAVTIAARMARETRLTVNLVCLLPVARNLPLGTPLPELETASNRLLEMASAEARKRNLAYTCHLERVRDVAEGVLQAVRNYRANHIILTAFAEHVGDELFQTLVDVLLRRAPCNVVVARKAPADADALASSAGSRGDY